MELARGAKGVQTCHGGSTSILARYNQAVNTKSMIRRKFIQSASMAAIGTAAPGIFVGACEAQQFPDSTGTELPKLKAPAGACDCHHHIYDQTRFPQPGPGGGPVIPNARVEEYQMLKARIGTTRDVIVTPLA